MRADSGRLHHGGKTAGKFEGNIARGTNLIDFVITVGSGDITVASSFMSGPLTNEYGSIKTYNNAYGYAHDEFEFGAYLGTSMFFNGAQTDPDRKYGVQSIAYVPEPGILALFGLGLADMAASRRRKHRQ